MQFTPSTGYPRFTVHSNSCGRPRSITRQPKPFRVGVVTGGPPFSCQRRISRLPSIVGLVIHSIRIDPPSFENAPYLTAFVASSWSAIQRARVAFGGRRTLSPVIAMHSVRSFTTPNGSNASLTRSSSPAPSQFSRVNKSCDRERAKRRDSIDSRTASGTAFFRKAYQTIDCTVESVFFTR